MGGSMKRSGVATEINVGVMIEAAAGIDGAGTEMVAGATLMIDVVKVIGDEAMTIEGATTTTEGVEMMIGESAVVMTIGRKMAMTMTIGRKLVMSVNAKIVSATSLGNAKSLHVTDNVSRP